MSTNDTHMSTRQIFLNSINAIEKIGKSEYLFFFSDTAGRRGEKSIMQDRRGATSVEQRLKTGPGMGVRSASAV